VSKARFVIRIDEIKIAVRDMINYKKKKKKKKKEKRRVIGHAWISNPRAI